MKRVYWTSLAILMAIPRTAECHQLDEYLQATRIGVFEEHLTLEIDLTPGVAIANRVFAAVDRDGDGTLSPAERDQYVRQVIADVAVSVDGRPASIALGRSEWPTWDAMREGTGTIRLEAVVRTGVLDAGRHRVRVVNTHQPEMSVYLINALMPSDRSIGITSQRRDVQQHGIDLELDVTRRSATILWSFAIVGVCGLVLAGRRTPGPGAKKKAPDRVIGRLRSRDGCRV